MNENPFCFNIVVWGNSYTQQLLDYTIPTLLSPNNMPELVKRRRCEFVFATTAQDEEVIKASQCFGMLSSLLPITFLRIIHTAEPDNARKWYCMSEGHKMFCESLHGRACFGIFLMPEMLISDGSLLHFDQVIKDGARAIVMVMVRLIEEEMRFMHGHTTITIPGRVLSQLVFEHIHAESRSFIITDPTFQAAPGAIIWPIEGANTWILRGLHAQPVIIDLTNASQEALSMTIDTGGFIEASLGGRGGIYIVPGSDLAMICSLTPRDTVPTPYEGLEPTKENLQRILYRSNNGDLHRWYFAHLVLYHSGDLPLTIQRDLDNNTRYAAELLGVTLHNESNVLINPV